MARMTSMAIVMPGREWSEQVHGIASDVREFSQRRVVKKSLTFPVALFLINHSRQFLRTEQLAVIHSIKLLLCDHSLVLALQRSYAVCTTGNTRTLREGLRSQHVTRAEFT